MLKENLANKNIVWVENGTFRVAEVVFYFLLLCFSSLLHLKVVLQDTADLFFNRLPFSSPNSFSLPLPLGTLEAPITEG